MNREKPKVGDALWIGYSGNAARVHGDDGFPVTVEKVGRKYFTVKGCQSGVFVEQFHLDDWRQKTEFTPDYELFQTEQEWKDKIRSAELVKRIRNYMGCFGPDFTLDQLEQIAAIMFPELRPGDPCPDCGDARLDFDAGSFASREDPGDDPELFCPSCGYSAPDEMIDWNHLQETFRDQVED